MTDDDFYPDRTKELIRKAIGADTRPEAIWQTYIDEMGQLEKITDESLLEVLNIHRLRAWAMDEKDLRIPYAIVDKFLEEFEHKQRGTKREGGRPRKSWLKSRFHDAVPAQFRARKAQLIESGLSHDDAEQQAAEEIAEAAGNLTPSTVLDWSRRGHGHRRKKP